MKKEGIEEGKLVSTSSIVLSHSSVVNDDNVLCISESYRNIFNVHTNCALNILWKIKTVKNTF